MKENTVKKRIREVIYDIPINEYTQQATLEDICKTANISIDDLYPVINQSDVSRGLLSIASLEISVGVPPAQRRSLMGMLHKAVIDHIPKK